MTSAPAAWRLSSSRTSRRPADPLVSEHAEATIFLGKYELLERIGSGGMAEVYRARMTGAHGFEKIVVVKTILPAHASNPAFIKMLVAEAKISSMLHHPNIVQTYELGEFEGQHYIAMEHVAGIDWLEVLTRSIDQGSRPPTELVVFVLSEVLKGLDHAHGATDSSGRSLNLVHRDVSPSNILVSFDGEVKLMDFGVARADLDAPKREPQPISNRTLVNGKLAYQSPELVARQGIDHRSDLFAVGIVLFESLTLRRLFTGDSDLEVLTQIRDADIDQHLASHPYIPEPIKGILSRALARHPNDRFESALAFQGALLDYLFEIQVRVSQVTLAAMLRELSGVESDIEEQEESSGTPPGPHEVSKGPTTRPTRRAPGDRPQALSTRPIRASVLDDDLDSVSTAVTPILGLIEASSNASAGSEPRADLEGEPTFEGTLQALAVTHFLYRLAVGRATGRLVLQSPEVNKEVAFRSGCPVHVQSSAHQELFGELLIARELLDRETLDRAVQTAQDQARPLGELLVSDGVIPSYRLLRLLEEQFRTRYLDLFCWQECTYAFYRGETEATQTVWMGTDPFELIAEGVRSQLSGEQLREAYTEQLEFKLVHRDNPHITHNNLRLSSRELRCYSILANAPNLKQALEACESEETTALLQVVFLLEQTELLSFAQVNE